MLSPKLLDEVSAITFDARDAKPLQPPARPLDDDNAAYDEAQARLAPQLEAERRHVLDTLTRRADWLTTSEVATATNLPGRSCSSALCVLAERGQVARGERGKRGARTWRAVR